MKILLKKIKWKLTALFYGNKGQVSIGDLFYVRDYVSFIQYILMARLLDIERFRKNDDTSFYFTNTLSRITSSNTCSYVNEKEIANNISFKNLIQSVDLYGYDEESRVLINGDYYLANGTHRASLCLNINKHMIPALFIGGDVYYDDSFIAQLESTTEGKKLKNVFDTKLKVVEEQLKNQHILCSCVVPLNINKTLSDLIDYKIGKISRYKCHYIKIFDKEMQYIGFLPQKFDYTIKQGKLYFKSVLKLKKELEHLVPGCRVNACFIDGKNSLEGVNKPC
jgi:hypothetical protein